MNASDIATDSTACVINSRHGVSLLELSCIHSVCDGYNSYWPAGAW